MLLPRPRWWTNPKELAMLVWVPPINQIIQNKSLLDTFLTMTLSFEVREEML